ncbi:MAG: hypothetical protein A2W25_15605 [candidate division Zixibacteria bacterium RBG_16_53_22]|nr:MAG: hypothetical protein A2W25_15605 [candidate division Zixibacteria bacterium RBG_16_53_22]
MGIAGKNISSRHGRWAGRGIPFGDGKLAAYPAIVLRMAEVQKGVGVLIRRVSAGPRGPAAASPAYAYPKFVLPADTSRKKD